MGIELTEIILSIVETNIPAIILNIVKLIKETYVTIKCFKDNT